MCANTYFCSAHHATATEFCLCGQVPVFLCVTCLPKHDDKSSHDVFPMAYLELYQALENNKAELMRHIETVKHCNGFLDNALAREAAVLTEANNLINDLVRCYQGWLNKNHSCFTNLVESLREEVALLMTAPNMTLSPLSQIIVERSNALSSKEENLLCAIPEEKSLKEIVEHCKQALTKSQKAQQHEYENEVQQAFMKLSQGVQQVPTEEVKAPAQKAKAPAQRAQQVPAEEVKASVKRTKVPAQGVQQVPAEEVKAPVQRAKVPAQRVQQVPAEEVKVPAQRASVPAQRLQQVPTEEVKAPAQRAKAPAQRVQQVPAEEVKAPAQRAKAPAQRVQQVPVQGDVQKLIAVLEGEVKLFNVATSQWQQLCALRREINVSSSTSSTFIAPSTIFLCGGGDGPSTCHVGNLAYMLQADNGSVQELPHMSAERNGPGVAWDSERKALYVFGGSYNGGTCYTDPLRTSEMFLSNQWSPLPEMHQSRGAFNPCWHCCLVYLCGGYTNSVETYDPRSNTFALQDFTLPEGGFTTAVVSCGVVTVVSKGYISKLQQGSLTSQKHENYMPWSNCTPVVIGGAIYVCYNGTCLSIDLNTGALLKTV